MISPTRLTSCAVALAVGATLATLVSGPAAATVVPGGCQSPPAFADLRSRGQSEVARRVVTLDQLSASLSGAADPFGVDGGLEAALGSAKTGLSALGQQIETSCYPTREALRADVAKIFTDYRVYWLRVPQSKQVEVADHLGVVRAKLATVAQTLAGLLGSNAKAASDLAGMNQQLATCDAALGTAPTLAPNVAAVPGLAPAADMTANVSALRAGRADLQNARRALGEASSDAKKVLGDLGH